MDLPDVAESTVFKDAKGREWDCRITLAAARRIDTSDFSALGVKDDVSILEPSQEFFTRMLTDTRLIFAMVWAVVYPQAKKYPGFPDPEKEPEAAEIEFADGLDGEAIERGKRAFWRAVADFFPDRRTALLMLVRRVTEGQRMALKKLEELDPAIERAIKTEINRQFEEGSKRLGVV